MSKTRNSPSIFHLCASLELRYSICVAKSCKHACGYVNRASFYFYSTANKRMVGNPWYTTYGFTKKTIKAASGKKPPVHEIKSKDILEALEHLLNKNVDLQLDTMPPEPGENYHISLDENELLVYWITHFSFIYAFITSSLTPDEVNKKIAKLFFVSNIASFNLSSFETSRQEQLKTACNTLVSNIRHAFHTVDHKSNNTTGVNQAVQLIRYAINCFLSEKDINSVMVNKLLLQESSVKPGAVAKVTKALRLKSIPSHRYRELWSLLTDESPMKAENTALLTMLFLGLTAEEACGLRVGDFRLIPDRQYFYQLRVTHKYSLNKAQKYSLEILDEEHACRNIPLPFQIRKLIEPFTQSVLDQSEFLFRDGNMPLNPEKLIVRMNELLDQPKETLSITDKKHNKLSEVDISFQSQYYRESCRHYWQYQCGLTMGEICYLSALTPPDTASAHYIDFNNGAIQYRMLKQLEYAIALFASQDMQKSTFHKKEWTPAVGRNKNNKFYSFGTVDRRASMDIHIESPVKLILSSNRGIKIYKE